MKARFTRRATGLLLLFTSLLVGLPAGAQTEATRLRAVQIDLWPDYDQPAVLVLITAQLPAETPLPATVVFKLPAAAGNPSAVAHVAPDGGMFNIPYQTSSEDYHTLLSLETTEPLIRVEYYLPYERAGDSVHFTYNWSGGPAVDELNVLFQEPVGAMAVELDDEFEDIGILQDGRRYYRWQIGAIGEGESRSATLSYVAPASVPVPAAQPPAEDRGSVWPLLFAGAGGLLIGGGLGWFLAQRRQPAKPTRTRQAAKVAYCSQCGARHMPQDLYCRQCGAQVR